MNEATALVELCAFFSEVSSLSDEEAVSDSSFACNPIAVTQHFVMRDLVAACSRWLRLSHLASSSYLVYYVYVFSKPVAYFELHTWSGCSECVCVKCCAFTLLLTALFSREDSSTHGIGRVRNDCQNGFKQVPRFALHRVD